jgi:hypothetical protein
VKLLWDGTGDAGVRLAQAVVVVSDVDVGGPDDDSVDIDGFDGPVGVGVAVVSV